VIGTSSWLSCPYNPLEDVELLIDATVYPIERDVSEKSQQLCELLLLECMHDSASDHRTQLAEVVALDILVLTGQGRFHALWHKRVVS